MESFLGNGGMEAWRNGEFFGQWRHEGMESMKAWREWKVFWAMEACSLFGNVPACCGMSLSVALEVLLMM